MTTYKVQLRTFKVEGETTYQADVVDENGKVVFTGEMYGEARSAKADGYDWIKDNS